MSSLVFIRWPLFDIRNDSDPAITYCPIFQFLFQCARLPKDQFAIEGAPNLRQVPGYLVFGTGQPTKEGFQKVLQYLLMETGCFGRPAKSVLWTNMRQV